MKVLLIMAIGDCVYELVDPAPDDVQWLIRWRRGLRSETFEAMFPNAKKQPAGRLTGSAPTGVVVDDF